MSDAALLLLLKVVVVGIVAVAFHWYAALDHCQTELRVRTELQETPHHNHQPHVPAERVNTWTLIHPSGHVPPKRLAHAACSVGDQVFIFGGCYGSAPLKIAYVSYDDLWIYTEHTDTWAQVAHTGETPSARFYHSMIDMDESTILLFGGFNVFPTVPGHGSFSDLYRFDIATHHWEKVVVAAGAVAPSARGAHAAIAFKGSMYVFGGFAKIGPTGHLNELWKFDLEGNQQWSQLPLAADGVSSPEGRIGFSFVMFNEDTALLTSGGCSTTVKNHGQCDAQWLFKPAENAWSLVESRGDPGARRATSADVAVGGIVYQFGGLFQNGTQASLFDDLHAFETNSFTWLPLFPNFNQGPRPPPTFGHSLVRIQNRLVLFGGRINSPADPGSSQLWEYTTMPHY